MSAPGAGRPPAWQGQGQREGQRETEISIDAANQGSRLDAFLARQGLAASVGAARRLIDLGAVQVDGKSGRKGQQLRIGQVVRLSASAVSAGAADAQTVPPAPELPLVILHADQALVAVDKPAGLPTHPVRPGQAPTLASALIARFPECAHAAEDPREAGFVHRLDVGTSGVIVAARSRTVWQQLRRTLGGEGSEKVYLAEVVPPPAPLAREHQVVETTIGRKGRRSGQVQVGTGRGQLPARTEVIVRQRRPRTWLMEARLRRGRAHQVRAHLHHLGTPVLGDPLYTTETARALAAELGVVSFRLHAWKVSFTHPVTGEPMTIEAPPPPWAV